MLVCKGRGIQSCIGNGICDSIIKTPEVTGTMNEAGLFSGSTLKDKTTKVFGIENFYGNIYKTLDGLITNSTASISFKGNAPYNNSGYDSISDGLTRNTSQYPTNMIPVLDGAALFPSVMQASSGIGWPDMAYVRNQTGENAIVGGCYTSTNSAAGPFFMDIDYTTTETVSAKTGARLVL